MTSSEGARRAAEKYINTYFTGIPMDREQAIETLAEHITKEAVEPVEEKLDGYRDSVSKRNATIQALQAKCDALAEALKFYAARAALAALKGEQ